MSSATPSDYRYERKWKYTALSAAEVRLRIKLHSALFCEIYQPREVHNIYLDSYNFENYFQNEAGIGRRSKCRIRWYGCCDGAVTHPTLEFKNKNGDVGTKHSFSLASFTFDRSFGKSTLNEVLGRSELPREVLESLRGSIPVLNNSYRRTYYLSVDKRFRATVDTDLRYRAMGPCGFNANAWQYDYEAVILELKYDKSLEVEAKKICREFPSTFERHSKYVRGIDAFNW